MRDDNSVVGASSPWAEIPKGSYEYRDDPLEAGGTTRKITVKVRKLPENVYLGVSDDLPGMTVEGKTLDEVIEEAREVAKNLLELAGEQSVEERSFVFIFHD